MNNYEFLDELHYFWTEKEDIERCSGFDKQRLFDKFPELYLAWYQYKLAYTTLTNQFETALAIEYQKAHIVEDEKK